MKHTKKLLQPVQVYMRLIDHNNRTYDRVKTFKKDKGISEDENEVVGLQPEAKEEYIGLLLESAKSLRICSGMFCHDSINEYNEGSDGLGSPNRLAPSH